MPSSQPPDKSRDDAEHPSFAARLKQKYGADVDPEVSLEQAAADIPSSASNELLRRLSTHSLKDSRYKLQGEIARGGMGAILKVWDEDLRRTLAMKVILGKADSPADTSTPPVDTRTLGRFLEEAQVTGQLDHPGIAPVHELGLDSDGRVYFTMKLVKGRDLKHIFDLVFADKEGWNETRALSVILKVCEAMAYAHTKGVIHRDLKPANVMVGNFGEVYVMDWGLARVLGRKDTRDIRLKPDFASSLTSVKTERRDEREEAADSPLVTMDGDVVGTPAYMPPEQARGEIEKLSARSDVYALGAMLYHLLARRMPYVPHGARLTNRTVLAMVVEGPPKRLHELRSDLPAELVAICEKAMSRGASERYPNTLALAEDLRAYLEHRVVGAHETGALAELKKWVERNKALAFATGVGITAILAGTVVVSVLNAQLRRSSGDLLAQNTKLGETTAQLTQANRRLETLTSDLEAAQEQLKKRTGELLQENATQGQNLQKSTDDLERTRQEQQELLERLEQTLPPEHPDLQSARTNLGATLTRLGRVAEARALLEQVVEVSSRTLPDDHPDLQTARWNLASALASLGETARARELFEKVLEVQSRTLPDDHPNLQQTRSAVAGIVRALGDLAGARALFEQVLEVRSRTLPDDHPSLQIARQNLASTLHDLGDLAGARALQEKVLEVLSRTLPDDHPDLQRAQERLAATLYELGDLAGARELQEQVLEVRSRTLPEDHPDLQTARQNLALTLLGLGELTRALELEEQAVGHFEKLFLDDHPLKTEAKLNLAGMLQRAGDLARARTMQEDALAVSRRTFGSDHPTTQRALRELVETVFRMHDYARARALQEGLVASLRSLLPKDHRDVVAAEAKLQAIMQASLGERTDPDKK